MAKLLQDALLKAKKVTEEDIKRVEAKIDVEVAALAFLRVLFCDATTKVVDWPKWTEDIAKRRNMMFDSNMVVASQYNNVLKYIDFNLMRVNGPLWRIWEYHADVPWPEVRQMLSRLDASDTKARIAMHLEIRNRRARYHAQAVSKK